MIQRLIFKGNQMRRDNYIDDEVSEDEIDNDEEQLVLRMDGKGRKPFYMEGLMCRKHLKAIIDTVLPVSIQQKKLPADYCGKKVVVRDLIDIEQYVYYNKKDY